MKDVLGTYQNNLTTPVGYVPSQVANKCIGNEHIDSAYKKEVKYTINEYGQRFLVKDTKYKILFAGCSMTFGTGVDDTEVYPYHVDQLLGDDWNHINVGHPGSGPDVQIANITWAINNFKIDKLCWYMSDPHRQIIVPEENVLSLYVPVDENILDNKKLGRRFIEVNAKLEETWWQRTYWNIYTLFSLCKAKEIPVYMTCWQGEYNYRLKDLKQEFGVKELGNMRWQDRGRDDIHPGPESHRDFAKRIVEVLNEV